MFISFKYKIVNADSIDCIICEDFLDYGEITIHYKNEEIEYVSGVEALQLIMKLAPDVLEGKKGKYYKNAWVVHNLIGHPVMQLLSWFGFKKAAIWVHDRTIPTPQVKANVRG